MMTKPPGFASSSTLPLEDDEEESIDESLDEILLEANEKPQENSVKSLEAVPSSLDDASDFLQLQTRVVRTSVKMGSEVAISASYFTPVSLPALRAFAPTTQYLFGTDFPIEPMETTVVQLPNLKLPADVQHAMDRGNAERLWPKFK